MKLIVSDLDGTLFPKKSAISDITYQKNLKAIHTWINKGHQFAIATARGLQSFEIMKETLGFEPIYIGKNGAETRISEDQLIVKTIPAQVFMDVAKLLKEHHLDASATTMIQGVSLWSSLSLYPAHRREGFTIKKEMVEADINAIDPTSGVPMVQVFIEKEYRDHLMTLLKESLTDVWITTSDEDLIDIGPINSSKGISVLEVAKHLNIDQEDVIVIGDSQNDISMFEACKHSYCIDHAEDSVKAKANHSVSSVWQMIEMELEKES